MNLRNPIIIATLLASIGLTAVAPQLPSRVFAAPPPTENRVEKVVSYQRIVNGGLRDDVPVADMGTIIRVSHPSFSARQEDEAEPSRGLYAIQLEKIVSRATGSTGNPDLSRLQVYYPQGSLVLAVPERINIVNIGIYRAGQPFPAEPSSGYEAIRELIQRGVEKTITKHPFVASVAGLLERYAKAPESRHPSFKDEKAYDIKTFLWDGIPIERCEGDVVIKIDAEYEVGFNPDLDKIYACLRVEETIEDSSAPTEKIIKLTKNNSTTPRQVEFSFPPVEVIGAASNREASLTGKGDVGTVLADLTARVTTFWNAFKEGSQSPRDKQRVLRDISDYFIPELYEGNNPDMNFILLTFPLGTNPLWNNTLGAYFNGRRIELLINNIGQPTPIISGSPDEINKLIEKTIEDNINKLIANTATLQKIQELKSKVLESIRAISENTAGLQIQRYAFITIPITLGGPDFDKYSEDIIHNMENIKEPIFNNNTCNFGQLWVQIKGNWYVAATDQFYANFKKFINQSEEDAMDTVNVANLNRTIYMAIVDNEISLSPTNQQYNTQSIGTVFTLHGYYRGEQFRAQYRDRATDKLLMRISPELHPDDGIPEGYVIEMDENGKPTLYIFLDEDWRREIPNTKIQYGKRFQTTVPFNFDKPTEKKQGIYIIKMPDDPERLTKGYATHHGGVMVGDLTDADKSTMIIFR